MRSYRFAGLRIEHDRLVARFESSDAIEGVDVRHVPVDAGFTWCPGDEREQPVADLETHIELVARASEEAARARSVAVVAAFDRGAHLHRAARGRVRSWAA